MFIAIAAASLVERVGWLLVHSVWQFALIAIVLAVVLRVMRRASPRARYAAALVAWGLMLAAPAATWLLLPTPDAGGPVATVDVAADDRLQTRGAVHSRQATAVDPLAVSPVTLPPNPTLLPTAVDSLPVNPASAWTETLVARIAPWLNTLVVAWCIGVCVFGAWSAAGWIGVRRLLRRDVASVPDEMTTLLVGVLKRVGLNHRVRLLQSPHVDVPLVVGWLRPVILLPVCVVTGFPPAQLEAVLAHELAHIRRHDYVVNLLQTLSETVFFYHPALWWVSGVVRREREHCCDELAARALGNRAEYGRALLALEELRGTTPALALGAKGGSLLERIQRLAQREPSPRWSAEGVVEVALIAAVVLTAAAWTAVDAGRETDEDAQPVLNSDAETGGDAATFSFGGRVEILALGTHDQESPQWWDAQGKVLESVPFTWSSDSTLTVTPTFGYRRVVFQVHDLPEDAHVQWKASGSGLAMGGRVTLSDGTTPRNVFTRYFSVDQPAETFDLRVGVATGPWKSVVSMTGAGAKSVNQVNVLLSAPVETETETSVVVTHNVLDHDYRMVAIDTEGQVHGQIGYGGYASNGVVQATARFSNLTRKEIERFEFQLREYEWIEIADLPLAAGSDADHRTGASLPDSDRARELALRAHQMAAAIDSLPRFYLHAQGGTRTFRVMENAGDDPVANMLQALDEPVVSTEWYRHEPVFGWDEQHFLAGSESPNAYAPDQPEANDPAGNPRSINYRWGSRRLGAYRDEIVGRVSQCGFRKDAAAMWDNCFVSLNYYQVTPHQFWWGDTSHDNQTFNKFPPTLAEYGMLEDAEFDGEVCHVVESPSRQERLWISRTSGLIRGYLHSSYHGPMTKFYASDAVTAIVGKKFASQHEYASWYSTEYDQLPLDKRAELQKAWIETADFSAAVPSLLVRFRDFREVAPGLWWPFREDRAQGHKSKQGFECMRSTCEVDEIRLDFDLVDRVQGLMPKEGEQVQDQRHAIPVDYKYRASRSETEILELVDKEYQERLKGQEAMDRLTQPYAAMVGQPAPAPPGDGWVGGARPNVSGKPYLLHFWATWCGPCKNDLPILKRVADDGAMIIGMHPSGTPVDDVQKAIDENELPYATLVELKDQPSGTGRTIAGYPADVFPYCVLVDAQGKVAAHGSLPANNGEILAKFRELRAAVNNGDRQAAAGNVDQGEARDKSRTKDAKPDNRVRFTIIQAKHVLLLDGKQVVTWPDIDAKIAALPNPQLAYPQLYVTRGAMEAGLADAAQKEVYELHRKYKLGGHSVGSLTPRTDVRYDRIATAADLVPDPALRVEGTVVDAEGLPVAGAEVVLVTPVDDSLSYKEYDIAIVEGRVRNSVDEVLTVADAEGRFAVYPPQDAPFSVLALHPDVGIALVDGEQLRKEPKATLLKWGGIVAEFSEEPEEQTATLYTQLEATPTRPRISIAQYWVDLQRPEKTLVFGFTHVPPIWQTSIMRSFESEDGGMTSIPGASVGVLLGETRKITLGPVSEQQREFLKGIRERLEPRGALEGRPAVEGAARSGDRPQPEAGDRPQLGEGRREAAGGVDAPESESTGATEVAAAAAKREEWVGKLLRLKNHNQTAFAVGPLMIFELPPEEALAVTRAAWPQIKVDEVKTGLLKTFEFDRHPQVLEVLDLGATDESEEVRKYACAYLKNYAFRDFRGDQEQYAAWRKESAGRPALEVIKANAATFVSDQRSKTPGSDQLWWLELTLMLNIGGNKSSYPEKAVYLRDAGLVDLLNEWASNPQSGPHVKEGTAELVKQIEEAATAERRPAVEGAARSGDQPQPEG